MNSFKVEKELLHFVEKVCSGAYGAPIKPVTFLKRSLANAEVEMAEVSHSFQTLK